VRWPAFSLRRCRGERCERVDNVAAVEAAAVAIYCLHHAPVATRTGLGLWFTAQGFASLASPQASSLRPKLAACSLAAVSSPLRDRFGPFISFRLGLSLLRLGAVALIASGHTFLPFSRLAQWLSSCWSSNREAGALKSPASQRVRLAAGGRVRLPAAALGGVATILVGPPLLTGLSLVDR
jgi:hypothetical protein